MGVCTPPSSKPYMYTELEVQGLRHDSNFQNHEKEAKNTN